MHRSWRCHAFTLIELLIVIAILVILAAILFPVFEQCVKKAESASCLSNLRSLAVATSMYADDHDDLFPPALVPATPEGMAVCWDRTLNQYLHNEALYCCPSDQNPTAGPSWTYSYQHSYGANLELMLVGGYWGVALPRYRVCQPAQTVLYFELAEPGSYGWRPSWGDSAQYLAARHLGGANFVFCGGNAKWMKPSETTAAPGMWAP